MTSSNSKQVAVTGAGRGIGKAITTRFLREGWEVWALVRSPDSLASLSGDPSKLHPVRFDGADQQSVLDAGKQVAAEAPGLKVLVNNAGVSLSAPLAKTSPVELARMMAINFTAPFLLCQALMPPMAKQGGGRVVDISGVDSKDKRQFIEDLTLRDADFLVDEFDRVDCGVDTTIEVECPECRETQEVELPFDSAFFLPGKERTARRKARSTSSPT